MKQITGFAIRSILLFLILGLGVVLVDLIVFPSRAFAAEISVQTKQILPPGGDACPQLQATEFTAYIYDNALHSFEFNVSDSSYVAFIGTVGDTAIPFQLMTRHMNGSILRIHVDIATTPIRGLLPITVTLLSAKQGQPVCLSVVAVALASAGSITNPASPPVSNNPPPEGTGTSTKPITQGSTTTMGGIGVGATTGSSTSTTPAVAAGAQRFLENICASGRAPVMWFILLVIYAAFVWAATSGKIKISFAERLEWTAAAIVVPLVVLLALWYFPKNCRAEAWVPAVGIVIAIAALLATYGKDPVVTKVIALPESRK